MDNQTWMRYELQTICNCFDKGTMSLKTAKARVYGYYGVEIKARSKNDFIKKFSQAINEGCPGKTS